MPDKVQRIENETNTRTTPTIHPLVAAALTSDLARALKGSLAAVPFIAGVLWLLGNDWQAILRAIVLLIAIAFGLVWLGENLHLLKRPLREMVYVWYATTEARAETLTGVDWNRSGAVGDVPSLAPGPVIEVTERPLVVNRPYAEERRWRSDVKKDLYFTESELAEFVRRGKAVGIARRFWTGERATNGKQVPAYVFNQTGRKCTRAILDLMVKTIEQRVPEALEGRADGHDGRIVDAEAILRAFDLAAEED